MTEVPIDVPVTNIIINEILVLSMNFCKIGFLEQNTKKLLVICRSILFACKFWCGNSKFYSFHKIIIISPISCFLPYISNTQNGSTTVSYKPVNKHYSTLEYQRNLYVVYMASVDYLYERTPGFSRFFPPFCISRHADVENCTVAYSSIRR